MSKWENVLSSLYKSTGLASFIIKDGKIVYTSHHNNDGDILNSPDMVHFIEQCRAQKDTNVIVNNYHLGIVGMYLYESDEVLLLGYLFLGSRSDKETSMDLLQMYEGNKDKVNETMRYFVTLPEISRSNLIKILNFLNLYINHKELNLSQKNFIVSDNDMDMFTMFRTKDEQMYEEMIEDITSVHEQYMVEQHIMECIRSGDKEKLLSYQKYDANVKSGVLSNKDDILRQRKNEFICACTLASRAAIQGGLSVEQAYTLGSFYIQQVENLHMEENIQYLGRRMFLDFTIRVARILEKQSTYSSITKLTLNYVYDHIYDYISADIIADAIQISKNYILAKFKKEVGISLVDFIKQVKVSEAKLLLEYSDYSLIEISDMLSCSSQSFFTSMFHKVEGITPKQYRELKKHV